MASKPKQFDNHITQLFLSPYHTFYGVCKKHPLIDFILTGFLNASLEADTATRTLRRTTLFIILHDCKVVSVKAIQAVLPHLKYSTAAKYACLARGVSRAIGNYAVNLPIESDVDAFIGDMLGDDEIEMYYAEEC